MTVCNERTNITNILLEMAIRTLCMYLRGLECQRVFVAFFKKSNFERIEIDARNYSTVHISTAHFLT